MACQPLTAAIFISKEEKQSPGERSWLGAGIRGGRVWQIRRVDARKDPDAMEIRTGTGSLQLDRRNPSLVVFYNLRPDDVLSRRGEGRPDVETLSVRARHPARLSTASMERTHRSTAAITHVWSRLLLFSATLRIQHYPHQQRQQQ